MQDVYQQSYYAWSRAAQLEFHKIEDLYEPKGKEKLAEYQDEAPLPEYHTKEPI